MGKQLADANIIKLASSLILVLILSNNMEAQTENIRILLDENLILHVDDAEFRRGTMSLHKIAEAIDGKFKKRRLKRPQVRYYRYFFKDYGITLESVSFNEPSDKCRSLLIDYEGKDRYEGQINILGTEILNSTTFDILYQDSNLSSHIDNEVTHRNILLVLRLKGYEIIFTFRDNGNQLSNVEISSFIYDAKYREVYRL